MPGIHPSQSAEQALGDHPAIRACLVESLNRNRVRVVVAGATLDADDDESLSTEEIQQCLARFRDLDVEQLQLGKSWEASESSSLRYRFVALSKALFNLIRMRFRGPICVLIYPTAGARRSRLVRDMILLPAFLAVAKDVIIHFHSEGIEDALSQANPFVRLVVRSLYRACSAIVVTEHGQREPEALRMRRSQVIYNGIRDSLRSEDLKWRSNEEKPILLYCGRLSPQMGTIALLQAFRRLASNTSHAELMLLGSPTPPYSDRALEKDIKDLGLNGKVTWFAYAQGHERGRVFGTANLFVYPSVSPEESCSRSLLEAMCWRLPIVATRWKGIPELTGGDAWYADPTVGLADSLYEAMLSAIRESPQWSKKGHSCRRRYLENFTHEEWALALKKAILTSHHQ